MTVSVTVEETFDPSFAVAVMLVVPCLIPVTVPSLVTVAVSLSPEDHDIVLSVALSGLTVAERRNVPCSLTVGDDGEIEMLLTGTFGAGVDLAMRPAARKAFSKALKSPAVGADVRSAIAAAGVTVPASPLSPFGPWMPRRP